MKLKKGDEVLIVRGKDRGRTSKIERVFSKEKKVLISGVNIYKKHLKKRGREPGGIIEVSKPLPVSNVALICPNCKKKARIGLKTVGGEKYRICRKCGEIIK